MDDQQVQDLHKKFAIDLFNTTWDLIEKEDRNQTETDQMINACHASRYHWAIAGDAVNISRGEWLISRVYATIQRTEPCLYHAKRCLQLTLENNLMDFDLAFAYEAMARAAELAGDELQSQKYIALAKDAGAKIKELDDQEYFFGELKTI